MYYYVYVQCMSLHVRPRQTERNVAGEVYHRKSVLIKAVALTVLL